MSEAQRNKYKLLFGTDELLPFRCPHCMLLKRLRQLKAEAEQFAKGYGQTCQFTEEW
jgi:hypothetical protein